MDPIHQAQQELEQAKLRLKQVVQQARQQGRTWADIGQALGISRQAAFKRFGEVTNPVTGQTMTGAPMSLDKIHQVTEQVFDLISAAEYDKLQKMLHPDVREDLPSTLIADTWASVLTEVGAKEAFEDTHVVLPGGERIEGHDAILGTVVGVTTLQHEAGEMMGRVAVDEQLRVTGILIVPPGSTHLPF